MFICINGFRAGSATCVMLRPISQRLSWLTFFRHTAAVALRRTSSAGLLALAAIALSETQGFAAEQHITVALQAGQTYALQDLGPEITPEVTLIDHHPFTVQCPSPGRCF